MKTDALIDLVYNVKQHPLTYTNYDELPRFDGVVEADRIDQILQQIYNTTGTYTVDLNGNTVARDGVRMAGFRLELGYGVGEGFVLIDGAGTDGLQPNKVLGWELRPCMPDHFFDSWRGISTSMKTVIRHRRAVFSPGGTISDTAGVSTVRYSTA